MMALTPTQLSALKNDIATLTGAGQALEGLDPTVGDDAFAIAAYYNADSSPAFIVWRTDMTPMEINEAVDWSEVVGLTTNEMLAFQLLKGQEHINAALTSIRAAFNAIFPSQQQPNSNASLVAAAKRTAHRIEALLATGTGSDATPGTMTFEGTISYQDVLASNDA